MLILSGDLFVPSIDVNCGFLESSWHDVVTDLVIIVAAADCAPPQNHRHDLINSATAFVLELVVD